MMKKTSILLVVFIFMFSCSENVDPLADVANKNELKLNEVGLDEVTTSFKLTDSIDVPDPEPTIPEDLWPNFDPAPGGVSSHVGYGYIFSYWGTVYMDWYGDLGIATFDTGNADIDASKIIDTSESMILNSHYIMCNGVLKFAIVDSSIDSAVGYFQAEFKREKPFKIHVGENYVMVTPQYRIKIKLIHREGKGLPPIVYKGPPLIIKF